MLSLTWKALWYRPTRTVIALLQALIGALVVTLALALAFSQGRAAGPTDLSQLTAGTRTATSVSIFNVFQADDLPKLKQLAPDVLQLDVVGEQYISGLEVGPTRYKISGSRETGPDYPALTGLKVLHGSYFNRKDVEGGAKVLALSANVARVLYGQEDAVGKTVKVVSGVPGEGATPYRVVAITENASPQAQGAASPLFLPVAVSGYNNKASAVLVRARPGQLTQAKEQLLRAAQRTYQDDPQITSATAKKQDGFFFSAVGEPFNPTEASGSPLLRALYAVAALTLTVSSLGVLATLLVSIHERTRELGLRRALGATRAQIVAGLLLETGLTTLLGSVAGVGLALVLAPVLNRVFAATFLTFSLVVSLPLAGAVLALFVGLSVLFGLLPALLSTRLRPTEALRTQG